MASRKTVLFIIILSVLIFGNLFLLLLAFSLFPSYGGFTRQIIFIKPNDDTNSSGYFIIIDDLAPESEGYDIDWLLHSRGDVSIASDKQSFVYTVPSYISNDDVSLKVSFLEKINNIQEENGFFLPTHWNEDYPYDDLKISYCKARYSGAENSLMASVLFPKNDSDSSQTFPEITKKSSGLRIIGDTDYIYYNEVPYGIEASNPKISFKGLMFFLRQNKTQPTSLEYFYLEVSKSLSFKDTHYFSSSKSVSNILATYSNASQISGSINILEEDDTKITLFTPFNVSMVQIDGKNATFTGGEAGASVSFEIEDPCSFVVSSSNKAFNPEYDQLRDSTPHRVKPKKDVWEFDKDILSNLQHPYILFNQTELNNLKLKIQDPNKPWKHWYGNYTSGVNTILSTKISDYDIEARYIYVNQLVMKYAIDGGTDVLNKITDFLEEMDNIEHYSQDLRRAYAVQAYSIALDVIYNDLTQSEQKKLSGYLEKHAKPLMEMDLYPENNHRVVDAGGLGCAGLYLKDKDMIDIAIDTILIYYYTLNPADGGSYEGYSYNAFAMDEFLPFAYGLKRLNAYNFFLDPLILANFEFMAETLGPIGMPALFEDCAFSSRIQEVILMAAANINDTYPTKAANYQYIWEQVQQNKDYDSLSDNYYSYLNGAGPSMERIVLYCVNDTITAQPYISRKEVWEDSGLAFLRSEDKPNGLFLAFSCKNYMQSHVHYDENSFEIWAYGAYIVNNPGYPGFGVKYHDWTIQTEGSNTLLIAGSGQRQEAADGFIASISSPYFSMIVGQADKIYNDLGAFEYAPEFYYLIILNFILLGIACVMFLQISKSKDEDLEETLESKDDTKKDERIQSKLGLLKMSFLHPNRTQNYIYENDPYKDDAKFINRFIKLFIAGIMVLFFLILILDMKTMADYHLQYYEDKAAGLFEALGIAVYVILYGGIIITFLCSLAAIKIYNRINKSLIYKTLQNERTSITKKTISFTSSISLIWQIPVLVFGFILLYFTTAQSFKTALHTISIGSGSVTFIYYQVVLLFLEFIRNLFMILIFGIPFLVLTMNTFSHGIYRNTNGQISKKKARKISLISALLLIVIFFLLIAFSYVLLKLVINSVTFEGYIES